MVNERRTTYEPSYIPLHVSGKLKERYEKLWDILKSCSLCPHQCGVNRLRGELGRCKTGSRAKVSSFSPHYGEERPLVGRGGSGTIFFSHCNMACVFCQNYEISHLGLGREVGAEELSKMMLTLQYEGCHNINFVTPTHVVPQIVEALLKAIPLGLRLPLVYNSGGYDTVETLVLLEGIFDIYMPDIKYGDNRVGEELSGVSEYATHAFAAVKEMHRQVGDLQVDANGIAYRGTLVRHLVLPNGIAQSEKVLDFLVSLSPHMYVNIMGQYYPCYQAKEIARRGKYGGLGRRPTLTELQEVIDYATSVGLVRRNL